MIDSPSGSQPDELQAKRDDKRIDTLIREAVGEISTEQFAEIIERGRTIPEMHLAAIATSNP